MYYEWRMTLLHWPMLTLPIKHAVSNGLFDFASKSRYLNIFYVSNIHICITLPYEGVKNKYNTANFNN